MSKSNLSKSGDWITNKWDNSDGSVLKLEMVTDIRPPNLGSRAKEKKEREGRGPRPRLAYPRAHFYEILKPLNGCTALRSNRETVGKKRALRFQISQGNRLTLEINCDDSVGRGGSRDFSQGLNRAWPPERSSVFFPLSFFPSWRSRAGTWSATCTRPSRKARKSGKRNIAERGGWKNSARRKKREITRGTSSRERNTRAKGFRVHLFQFRFYLVGACRPTVPFSSGNP